MQHHPSDFRNGADRREPTEPSNPPTTRPLLRIAVVAAWIIVPTLPLIGFASLLLRAHLDPQWTSPRLHFVLFLAVGTGAFMLASLAGRAADRRGDARVFLLSLAFL